MTLNLARKAQFEFWRSVEPRAVFEWQGFYALRPLLKRLPKGDGHPVIVFPGFVSSDRATKPLRGLLDDLGYESHGWGLGSNILFDDELENEMIALVREVAQDSGRKVTLIGWSLGGLYAREVAKTCPDQVRAVISLGSPISGKPYHSNAHWLFKALNGEPSAIDQARYLELNIPPAVPTSSIFSKTDGVVAWEGSVQNSPVPSSENANKQIENIVVPASHLGLGVNPVVMAILANRLAQPEGHWAKFEAKGLNRLFVKSHH